MFIIVKFVSADYCVSTATEYKAHPRGCHYFVRCVNWKPFGLICGTGTCFSNLVDGNPCVACRNASPPCSDTET